jgi:hypothetical protein
MDSSLEQRPVAASVQPPSFALPADLVQVETSHKAQSVQVEQPKPEELLPRRPRRAPLQSDAAEPASSEPLVQIETRHERS